MSPRNRNFIYAYDDDKHQIIVIDAETGKRVEPKDNQVLSILSYLKDQQENIKLREFAVWCARKANNHIKPVQKKFIDLAEKAIQKKVDRIALQQLYTESEGEAIATDTIGLRRGSIQAPGFLASRECINPDAFEGAKNAARFYCLWAEMNRKNSGLPDFLDEMGPAASEETIKQTEQQQINHLLDLINDQVS